jgi:hypothetical protein
LRSHRNIGNIAFIFSAIKDVDMVVFHGLFDVYSYFGPKAWMNDLQRQIQYLLYISSAMVRSEPPTRGYLAGALFNEVRVFRV